MEVLLGPHWAFIAASYAVTVAVLGGLIVWIVLDGREQRALLDMVDPEGRRDNPERIDR